MTDLLTQPSNCSSCAAPGRPDNQSPTLETFVIILVPPRDDGRRPDAEAHYPYSDPLYPCLNRDVCDCRPKSETHRASIEDVMIGGRFDGRLTGQEAQALTEPLHRQVLERNTVALASVLRPLSCYALVTPDGLWHESFEPEPQDIALAGQGSISQTERTLTGPTPRPPSSHQVAWRNELERLFALHSGHWAVGCTVHLQFGTLQKHCTG